MQVIYDISTMRDIIVALKVQNLSIGFVPTMGALHRGHIALIDQAKSSSNVVVASIFVNKKQFDRQDDYDTYPRQLDADLKILEEAGVDYVFAPSDTEMWPPLNETIVNVVNLSELYIGKVREGHFQGVTTVVAKLFNIVNPDKAFFGEKDFQQLSIVRRMVFDLNFNIEIVGVPIVREDDGVAYSSRNQLLSIEERKAAVVLWESLKAAQIAYTQGITRAVELKEFIRKYISREALAKIDTIDIISNKDLSQVEGDASVGDVILLFVRFGSVQLLDQYTLR